MKEIGIGLLGFGTVGAGVVEGLARDGEVIAERLGARPVLRRVADLDVETDRGVPLAAGVLTQDAEAVVDDPAVEVVVELIGGTGAARSLMQRALRLGKPVVTANKALLAEQGEEMFALAEQMNTDIYFGASVGGGIPIIRALREGLIANRILSVQGILNGTCNYILTRMEQEGVSFDEALAEAQAEGYAEADPGLDVDGIDTAHKAVILASLAYGFHVPMEAVHVEGIRGLAQMDIEYALDMGYRVKLLAVIRGDEEDVEVRVHPTLVPVEAMLASVSGVFNAVMVHGSLVGPTLYYGRGAGRNPTASTVIGDIADVVRNLVSESPRRVPALSRARQPLALRDMQDVETRYYMRLTLMDAPGVLAEITALLGQHGISIASVLQKEEGAGEYVPVVIVTHRAREREMRAALGKIDALKSVDRPTVLMRIEA